MRHTIELWQINPHTWLTEYLSACAGSRRSSAGGFRALPALEPHQGAITARLSAGDAAPGCLTVVRYCGRLELAAGSWYGDLKPDLRPGEMIEL